MNDVSVKPVYTAPKIEDSKPSVSLWDWVAYYVFNLVRKPAVWRAKRKLIAIADSMMLSLQSEIMPQLYENRLDCQECRDAYMALNGQPFVSNIRTILRRMQCSYHFEPFNAFLEKHRVEFDSSDDVAAWICGFKR